MASQVAARAIVAIRRASYVTNPKVCVSRKPASRRELIAKVTQWTWHVTRGDLDAIALSDTKLHGVPVVKGPSSFDPSKASFNRLLKGVEGWTYLDELWALHEATRRVSGSEPLSVVEIGCWKGRSTIALALGVRSRGKGKVYAIDPHTGSKEHIEVYGTVDTFGEFLRNIQKAGIDDVVEPIRSTSHEASLQFQPNSVDVLFIDGSHEYEDVLRDIEDWARILADSALVAFNDPLWPGVYRAIREVVLRSQSPYRNPRYVANTLFFDFRRHMRWGLRDSASLAELRALMALRLLAQRPAKYAPRWAIAMGRRLYERLLP